MLAFIVMIISIVLSALHFISTANTIFHAALHLGIGGFIVGFIFSKHKFKYLMSAALTVAELIFHLVL